MLKPSWTTASQPFDGPTRLRATGSILRVSWRPNSSREIGALKATIERPSEVERLVLHSPQPWP
jgi:hypothetical protein